METVDIKDFLQILSPKIFSISLFLVGEKIIFLNQKIQERNILIPCIKLIMEILIH
ncbi:hypothetical protein ES705_34308 [subsurface metagenome]